MTGHPGGRIATRVLLLYALPAFVVALPTIPVYIHLPALYGVELGLGLAATGFILLAARAFDTATDPLIGALSDRIGFRGNHRKPWIAAGAVIAGLGLFKLLNPPAAVDGYYLLGWAMTLYFGWAMVSIPYTAWGAELSPDYNERTRITSWREGLALLGIVAAGGLNAVTASLGWSERESIGALAWIAIAGGVVAFPLLFRMVPEDRAAPAIAARAEHGGWWRGLASLASNRPFVRLLAAWFLNGLANGIPAALFFLYLEHGLGASERERPLFVLVYFVAAVAAIPLWQWLSGRLGKHTAWCWAMIGACAAFAAVPLIPAGGFAAFAAVCVITGMALGADLVLPPAIQADVVDYDSLRTRRARAGLQFALWAMSTKLALAAAVGLALPALEGFGFDAAAPDAAGKSALVVIYALVPVVIKAMAIAFVWGFPLTPGKQAIIRRWLVRAGRRRALQEQVAG
jgi:glycoside/pentoside/hexuronide:cation symporter, GPH family